MLAQSKAEYHNIWTFALAFYALPDVAQTCLEAQDCYGLDVTALIFGLHRAYLGAGFDAREAQTLAREWAVTIVNPLRKVRIALKASHADLDHDAAFLLRERVKVLELDAEHMVLNALSDLPQTTPSLSFEDALESLAKANANVIDSGLRALLKRLALSAQTM
jgi:uncharacterized protein (TIGR02444 family)